MLFSLTAILVVIFDQLTKFWIRSNLALGQSIPDQGFFRITHVHNSGAAFGLFPGQSLLLTIIASTGIVLMLVYIVFINRRFPYLDNLPGRLAMGLILGGTIGNLTDRLLFGYVTDFISVGIWPDFNIADSAVTVGAITIAFLLLRLIHAEGH